jgi:hypothetical protein
MLDAGETVAMPFFAASGLLENLICFIDCKVIPEENKKTRVVFEKTSLQMLQIRLASGDSRKRCVPRPAIALLSVLSRGASVERCCLPEEFSAPSRFKIVDFFLAEASDL